MKWQWPVWLRGSGLGPGRPVENVPAQRLIGPALLVLWVERLCVAFWPCAVLLAMLAGCALFALPGLLPVWLRGLGLLAALSGLAWLARRGVAAFAPPVRTDAEARLERDGGLAHRPFAALRDQPAGALPAQMQMWRLHQARARARLASARLGPPRPSMAARDPYALRAAALVFCLAGLLAAGPRAGARLADALLPGGAWFAPGPAPRIEAWIEPPAYTGLAPIFLSAQVPALSVPDGARLHVSVTGPSRRPSLRVPGTADADWVRLARIGPRSFQATALLHHAGRLEIAGLFTTYGRWRLSIVPNTPPMVAWGEKPGAALPGRAGTSLLTRLPWRAAQRWGVVALEAELRPLGHPDLAPLIVPLPLPGTPKSASGAGLPDLTANPYAGLMMTGRLRARDVSGQVAMSAPVDFRLPARAFHNPLARAIADLRRRLALRPDAPQDAANDLDALARVPLIQPIPGLSALGITLNLSADAALLTPDLRHPDRAIDNIPAAEARLWVLALALDGALPGAGARALAEARENLRQALEQHARGQLSDHALDQRLEALRQALQQRLDDIAREAMKQGAIGKFDPSMQHLSSPQMDRLIEKLDRAVREGRAADARQAMAELGKLMDQLKNAHIMTPQEAQAQHQAAQKAQTQMGAVQDLVRRESTLLDHTQARAPQASPLAPTVPPPFQNFDFAAPPTPQGGTEDPSQDAQTLPGDAPPDQPAPGAVPPPGQPPASSAEDARTQRALRRALGVLQSDLRQSGRPPPQNLDSAGQAMDDAASRLAQSQDAPAESAIGRAIAELQKGGQQMAQQMRQQSGSAGMQLSLMPGGQGRQGGQDGPGNDPDAQDGQGGQKRDPFGRQVDGNGTIADDPSLRVPDKMEQGRSRAILEELRRRDAERNRSQSERDYINRLLKPF